MDYYVKSVILVIESNYEILQLWKKYCGFLYEKMKKNGLFSKEIA